MIWNALLISLPTYTMIRCILRFYMMKSFMYITCGVYEGKNYIHFIITCYQSLIWWVWVIFSIIYNFMISLSSNLQLCSISSSLICNFMISSCTGMKLHVKSNTFSQFYNISLPPIYNSIISQQTCIRPHAILSF